MNARATKPPHELEAMIMTEVRKHPELSHVLSVHVGENLDPGPPNWKPAFVMDGDRNTPQKAFDIATALGRDFDRIF